MNTTSWKGASGYVLGRSHEKEQTPCQDRTLVVHKSGLTFIGLCDGAGSASHSHFGAAHTLEVASNWLFTHFDDCILTDAETWKHELLTEIISSLQQLADEHGIEIQKLASTLLFTIANDTDFISGHIGDGLIVSIEEELTVHSHAENGDYANVTFFTTSHDAINHLRINKGKLETIQGFALMSDGTSSSLYRKHDDYIAPAISTIASWLKTNDEVTVSEALEQNLYKVIRQKTFDDCSLAIMVKV